MVKSENASDIPVVSLAWPNLSTTDPDSTFDFYTGVFGWTFHRVGESFVAMAGEVGAALITPTQHDVPSNWHCVFSCDELLAVAERLEGYGGAMTLGPVIVEGIGEIVSLVDPSGNPLTIGVCESAAGYGMGVGAPVWVELGTSDPVGVRDFYSRLMDATPALVAAEGDYYRVLVANDVPIAGLVTNDDLGWRPYFQVDDVREAVASVQKAGGTVLENDADSPLFVGRALLRDPSGAVFGVVVVDGADSTDSDQAGDGDSVVHSIPLAL